MLRKFICLFLASFVLEGTCFNFTRDRQRRETFNLDNNYATRKFTFYNYKKNFCLRAYNSYYVVAAYDCSNDESSYFTLGAYSTGIDDGQGGLLTTDIIKFEHVQTGLCLADEDSTGLLVLQECSDLLTTQQWIQYDKWTILQSSFMISNVYAYGLCIAIKAEADAPGTTAYMKSCVKEDNTQWWSLWAA